MLDFLKPPVEAFQDFIFLGVTAVRNVFRSPHYSGDIFIQMDTISWLPQKMGCIFCTSYSTLTPV